MKILKAIILLITTTQLCMAQSVDFDLIKLNGLNFYSTKSEIFKKFGEPHKTYDPNYECGFLSTDSQDVEYLTLDYGKIKFTGNKKELFLLEQVDLENDCSIRIEYGNKNLTCETDLTNLIEIFGDEIAKYFGNELDGSIILHHEKSDAGIRLTIRNGKLIGFSYWSPC